MYLVYFGYDNSKGLRKGKVHEVRFTDSSGSLKCKVYRDGKEITDLEYERLSDFNDNWKEIPKMEV